MDDDESSVAILLATFNGADYLADQLTSVEAQLHKNWFIVASDDGSEDATLDILQAFKSKWGGSKLKIVKGPKKGYVKNFLSMANNPDIRAKFYAFCDQDDVWFPSKLSDGIRAIKQRQEALQDNHSAPIMYCSRTVYVDKNLNKIGISSSFMHPKVFRNALVQCVAGGNSIIFDSKTKNLLNKIQEFEPASHDWWIYLLVTGVGGYCIFDQKPSLLYRQHQGSLVGKNKGLVAKVKRAIKLFYGSFRDQITLNLMALNRCKNKLEINNREAVDIFSTMRNSRLIDRLRLFEVCGLYRQTRNGTIALVIAALFKKI
jgi:glycosyltransferase involved in cell wall biosynthesis